MPRYRILLEQETAFTPAYYYIQCYKQSSLLSWVFNWSSGSWKDLREDVFEEYDPIRGNGKYIKQRKVFHNLEEAERFVESLLEHNAGNVVKVYE